jgi:hypothetical protein
MADQPVDNRLLLESLGELWTSSRILDDVTELCDEYGNRFAGTESEARAREFIVGKFREYGLENVTVEPCTYTGWKRGSCGLDLLAPRRRSLTAISMVHAAPTPPEGLEGEVISVGQGTPEEFAQLGDRVRGKIAMATLGSPTGIPPLHRVGKYGRAKAAGAIAVIFPTEEPVQLIGTGTVAAAYREVGTLPAIGISHETWRYLLRQAEIGPLRARIKLDNAFLPNIETWNIRGDIPGSGADSDHILVGGHWDGHDRADAALDNAVGLFTALSTARALGRLKGKFRRMIRFVAFADEESWCVGSTNYVARHDAELDRIALMVNVDGISRYSGTHLHLGKRQDVADFLRKLVTERKLPLTLRPSDWLPGSSDDWPFLVTGVPSTFCTSVRSAAEQALGRGLDHTQADTVDKIDDLRARQASMVLAQLLAAVADSAERPGPKLDRVEMFRRLEAAGTKQELVDQGRWHPESILGM